MVYGYNIAAFQVCVRDSDGIIGISMCNVLISRWNQIILNLQTEINSCLNTDKVLDFKCLENSHWRKSPGSNTSDTISSRVATVGFSRLNGTIQTY